MRVIDCEHRTPAAVDAGYPYVTIPEMRAGRIDPSGARRISEADYIAWTRRAMPQDDDVVLSRRTNPGATAVAERGLRFALGQNLVLLRADGTRVHPPFLRWLVRGSEWWGQVGRFLNAGAVFDSLKVADIPNFVITVPPLHVQRKIAGILGTLDDKIELNRLTAATLEALTRTIFDARLVRPSQRGEADWPDVGLDGIGQFLNGLALQKYPANGPGSLPIIKIAQLHSGGVLGADQASLDVPAQYVVNDGDLLFSWSGSLECVVWTGGRGALNQHLFKVTPLGVPQWFLYLWIHQHLGEFRAIAAGKATTMGHIQRRHLSEARVSMPPPGLLRQTDRLIAPMFDAMVHRLVENTTITRLRDLMLPQLISGRLGVSS